MTDAQTADPREVAELAADMPLRFLKCRANRHVEHELDVQRADEGEATYEQVFRCSRCRRERSLLLDAAGRIVGRTTPRYPEGYLLHGYGRLDREGRAALRLAGITRSLERQADKAAAA